MRYSNIKMEGKKKNKMNEKYRKISERENFFERLIQC
jgi:hypothetical protein